MLAQSVNHVTLDTSPSPTKSERDSVGFWKGWCGARDGGAAIPPVVARIFSGDSTSPLTRDGHGCPKLNAQSFARMRNQQSVHKEARVMVQGEGWMFFQNGCGDGEGRCNGRGKPV